MALSKPMLVRNLKSRFRKLNPHANTDLIDWNAYADPSLTFSENVEIFMRAYPEYQWNEHEADTESLIKEFEVLVSSLEYYGVSKQEITEILHRLGYIRDNPSGLRRRINELQKQLDDLKKNNMQIESYVNAKIASLNLAKEEADMLRSFVNPEKGFEWNRRVIDDQAKAIVMTRMPAIPKQLKGEQKESAQPAKGGLEDLMSRYPDLKENEMNNLIDKLLELDLDGRCNERCQEILRDFENEEAIKEKKEWESKLKEFAIEQQYRWIVKWISPDGTVVSETPFADKQEAVEHAARIQKLIDEGTYDGRVEIADLLKGTHGIQP